MLNKLGFRKITTSVIIYVLLSVALGFLSFKLISAVAIGCLERYTYGSERYTGLMEEDIRSFQSYVALNKLKTSDINKLSVWNNERWYIYMIIKDSKTSIVYDSFELDAPYSNLIRTNFIRNYYEFKVSFSDDDATVFMIGFYDAKYRTIILIVSALLSCVFAGVLFAVLFSRKLKYMSEIKKSIEIIANGGLEYNIPIVGNDELSVIAEIINLMKNTILEQIKLEEEMHTKNERIISALSHDIRTPLTSVIVYLDMLCNEKYDNEEKRRTYTQNARTRAYQIKKLTDNLFAYMTENDVKNEKVYETVDGRKLINQIIAEHKFFLEDKGFHITEWMADLPEFDISVDIAEFRRILDNVSSNIEKYADIDEEVIFDVYIYNRKLTIEQTNTIRKYSEEVESHKIGLESSREIAKSFSGDISVSVEGDVFTVKIEIPIV